jgi:NADH:ubiquinone oxidoreductase subunit 3 (subunit A)
MKTDRVIRQSMIFLLSTIALFVVPHALAYNDATIEEADKSYQQGITAFNKKHWSYAKRYFVESFDYIPHSMTAYMLSVTFLKMESPDDALDYARKAMNSEPELEEPYSTGVKEIADWAREAKVDPYYCRIEVKTDTWDETKPASPKYRPPRPVVPQSRTLGIKPDPNVNVVKPFVTAKIIKPRDFSGVVMMAEFILSDR